MKKLGLVASLLTLVTCGVMAGPNEGGVLAVHGNTNGVETEGRPCDIPIPSDCDDFVPEATPDANGVEWFVALAVFPQSSDPGFDVIVFGIGDYDPAVCAIALWGPCHPELAPLEIPSDDWPGPFSGTAVAWTPECLRDLIVPVYYFGVYAYGPGTIPLGDHYPGQPASFTYGVPCVESGEDFQEDPIEGFGIMGCGGAQGMNDCPPGPTAVESTTWGRIKSVYE